VKKYVQPQVINSGIFKGIEKFVFENAGVQNKVLLIEMTKDLP